MSNAGKDIPEASRQATTSKGPDEVEDPDPDPDPVRPSPALRLRRPPAGLPRRDRRAWRALELERVQRLTTEAATAARQQRTGWQQGFLTNPPPGLGRRGRRAWLDSEREEARRWWQERRASNEDIDARAVGVLVIALLLGAAMIWGIVTSRTHSGGEKNSVATSLSAPGTAQAQVAEAPSTIATQPHHPAETVTIPVAAPSSSASDPTVVAPLAGMWQPAPMGGATPIPPATSDLIDPKSVAVQRAQTGPVSATDLATPVAAVTTWLTRTCPSSWTDPYGQNLQLGRIAMTTAGWAADDPVVDAAGARLWAEVVVPARQTRACSDLIVHLSADVPTTNGTAFVGYGADRVVTAAGTPAVVEHLVGARIVVQQSDGRWLVDRAVVGG